MRNEDETIEKGRKNENEIKRGENETEEDFKEIIQERKKRYEGDKITTSRQ